jgi:hypothetical protein
MLALLIRCVRQRTHQGDRLDPSIDPYGICISRFGRTDHVPALGPHTAKPVYSAVATVPTTKPEEKAAEVGGGGPSAECVERLSTPRLQRITVHCTRVAPRKAKEAPEQQVGARRQRQR